MSSDWTDVIMAAASGVVAVVFLVAAVRAHCERLACLAHAAMGLGMVGTFVPALDVVPGPAGALVFAAIAAWFLGRWLRGHLPAGGRGEAAHVVIAPAAMAVMYLEMGGAADGGTMDAAMGSGSGTAMSTGSGSPLLGAGLLVLVAYFLWYTGVLARRLIRTESGDGDRPGVVGPAPSGAAMVTVAPGGTRSVAAEVVTVAHVVMCVLMAVMFLGSI